jgi:thioredoxin reductase/polyferredoxin
MSIRPAINDRFESSVPGVYVIGDLAGSPLVKIAMEHGYNLAVQLSAKADSSASGTDSYDVLVLGAGAAGLNCALELKSRGLRVAVIEKDRIGSTVAGLPEGKWIYTEPEDRPVLGPLTLRAATKEVVVEDWNTAVRSSGLEVHEFESVTSLKREGGELRVTTPKGQYRTRRVVVATGKFGTPRKLGVPGEDLPFVQHRLFQTRKYQGERIVVVGGGNSAVEAALALSEANHVVLSYRGDEFHRLTRQNSRLLRESKNIDVVLNSKVTRFGRGTCLVNGVKHPCDHAFVLIGSEPPRDFLKSLGIRLENEWGWKRYLALVCTFAVAYTIYGAKQATGHEFWPFTGWGFEALSFFHRPWSFWYTVLYTAVMTVFGLQAMKRWGFDRKDRFQIWRYVSLIGFQWTFFFLIPEFLFQSAVSHQWLGERLASDPGFAANAWRSYGLVYAWPLFFYTFFGDPNQVWIIWGVVLSFVLVPLLVLFHGKRYCSWICGCGGLAETLGDRWRHLAPKGDASIRWERMNLVVLAAAVLITIGIVGHDVIAVVRQPAQSALNWYKLLVDTWLVGIIPVALYPFFGGKIWCRYWCPLAKMMEVFSVVFARFRVSRFAIASNDKCIACGECTRYCQVGIDVMRFALKQEEITIVNSSCIGCGICVTVCPMDVLSFAKPGTEQKLVQIQAAAR